jgi:hypothetical protein
VRDLRQGDPIGQHHRALLAAQRHRSEGLRLRALDSDHLARVPELRQAQEGRLMPQSRAMIVGLHEHSALRPRCRCGLQLDYAVDTNVCDLCSRRMHRGEAPLTPEQRAQMAGKDKGRRKPKEGR